MRGWAGAMAVLATVLLAEPAAAAQGEAVVVSTTAPNVRQGQLIRAGDWVDAPAGAVVTLMDASGRLVTITGRSRYQPAEASAAGAGQADARRVISAVAALVRTDRTEVEMVAFRNTGGEGCPTDERPAPLTELAKLLEQDCQWAARQAIFAAVAASAPPSLHLSGVRALRVQGRPLGMAEFAAQANFDAVLTCEVHGGAAPVAVGLGPKGAATHALTASTTARLRGRPLFTGRAPASAELVCTAEAASPAAPRRAEARAALAGP